MKIYLSLFVIHFVISLSSVAADPPTPFVDVTEDAGISATHRAVWDPEEAQEGYLAIGQAWGDYDNDGWIDLYVTGNLDPSTLYSNNGDGTFSVSTLSKSVSVPEIPSGGAVWADYDNDGWLDLYVLNYGPNRLFYNNGGVGFTDVTASAGVDDAAKGTTAAWGDYDNDGWLDLYVTNWSCFPQCDPVDFTKQQDRLYHNNGDGTFVDVTGYLDEAKTLGAGFAASFVDYDNDGDPDIYVVNDRIQNEIGNVLWRNDGPGCVGWCWTDVSREAGADVRLHGMGLAIGDYDNDQNLDFYFTEMVYSMFLLKNWGDGTFVNRAHYAQVAVNYAPDHAVGWGTAFFDYDNDGWLDLFMAATEYQQDDFSMAVSLDYPRPNYFFHNNGDGTFAQLVMDEVDRPSMGIAYADYDNDGQVDFVIGNWDEGYRLYRNTGINDNHWLTLHLIGDGPVNRDAIGARALLTSSNGTTQMREVKAGSGLGTGNDTALHFGLGQTNINSVEIRWPDGSTCMLTDVSANQRIVIMYRDPRCGATPDRDPP